MTIVLDSDRAGVEEDQDDYEPVKPLLLYRFPNPEAALFLVHPKVGVLFEPFGPLEAWSFLLFEQLCKIQEASSVTSTEGRVYKTHLL